MRLAPLLLLLLVLSACCITKTTPPESTTTTSTTTSTTTTTTSTTTTTTTTTSTTTTSTTAPRIYALDSYVLDSPEGNVTPTIDGELGIGEWSDASTLFLSELDRLYFKNDQKNLYILYVANDRYRFNNESTLFFDPEGDSEQNYAYGHMEIFLGIPLFEDMEDGEKLFCGSSLLQVPIQDCGKPFGYTIRGLRVKHMQGKTNAVSEVAIPLGSKGLPVLNESTYFWLCFGHPAPTCYPENMQCFDEPTYAELRLTTQDDNL